MTALSTNVEFKSLDRRIGFNDQLFALGSCFAQHMAQRLSMHKALMHAHPFGILFNPASIARSIKLINKELSFSEAILYDGLYYSLDAHGDIHEDSVNGLEQNLEHRRQVASEAWESARYAMITFGTAAVYEHRSSGLIVANCHRLPASEFDRYLLSVEDVVEIWSEIIAEFSRKTFLFSVSPIRHVRDGLHQNTVSKAVLHLALEELCRTHPNAHYVPAYEFFIDELRDYRFFDKDMCHPSSLAIDLLWQRFLKSYVDYEMQETIAEIQQLLKAMAHVPRQVGSAQHQQFCQDQLTTVQSLQQRFADRDWQQELNHFMF